MIALGAVAEARFANQVLVLCLVAALMNAKVYDLVALIVKLDDMGLVLMDSCSSNWARIRNPIDPALLANYPFLLKSWSVAGTSAMFLMCEGNLVHGWPQLHHLTDGLPGVTFAIVAGAMNVRF